MHKCIMVKIGGSKKRKLSKQRKSNENRKNLEIFMKYGKKIMNFMETGMNMQDALLA